MEQEIWKDVFEFEHLYQVSNFGRVRPKRPRYKDKQILKPGLSASGYYLVGLCKDKVRYSKNIHQLVAIAFLNHKVDGYMLVINHKNHIATDNRVENLEIVPQRQNANLKHIPHSSKYTGVSWAGDCRRWKAEIRIKGKSKYLGIYKDEKEASDAYEREYAILMNNL